MESGSESKSESAVDTKEVAWSSRACKGLLHFIWGEPGTDRNGNVAQIERALCAIRGFAILGLIPVMVYGALAGYCGTQCAPSGETLAVFRGLSVALLSAIAAFSVGGMLGFLFGLPRWGDAPQMLPPAQGGQRKDDSPGTRPEDKPKDKPESAATEKPQTKTELAGAGSSMRANRVRPNTGLEKVMDWLTTLIVGLGLVHIRGAIEHAKSVSGWVASAIAGESGLDTQANLTGGAAILLPYVIAGFFLVYLWAQRYMGREMLLADIESNTIEEAKREMKREYEHTKLEVKKENRQALAEVANIADQLLQRGPQPAAPAGTVALSAENLLGGAGAEPALLGVDPETVADIRRRYAKDTDWFYEPIEGFGPSEAAGRRIEAQIARATGSTRIFRVSLSVRSIKADVPLTSPVIFLLHHTFPDPIRRVQPIDGVATLTLLCTGSFIAGALVSGEPTRLSLDLSRLADVPQDFRDN